MKIYLRHFWNNYSIIFLAIQLHHMRNKYIGISIIFLNFSIEIGKVLKCIQ